VSCPADKGGLKICGANIDQEMSALESPKSRPCTGKKRNLTNCFQAFLKPAQPDHHHEDIDEPQVS
jgi:hypothetical protein